MENNFVFKWNNRLYGCKDDKEVNGLSFCEEINRFPPGIPYYESELNKEDKETRTVALKGRDGNDQYKKNHYCVESKNINVGFACTTNIGDEEKYKWIEILIFLIFLFLFIYLIYVIFFK